MVNKGSINDNELNKVSGGRTLPENWEKIADKLAPGLLKQYKGITYDAACELVKTYLPDPEDQALVYDYMKKYFPDDFPPEQ